MADIHAPSFSLAGKVVIQCGGSGLLGASLAAGLAASGPTLVLTSRERARLEPIVAAAKGAGYLAEAEELNPADEQSTRSLVERVLQRHGRIDGVVYNAVSRPMRRMTDDLARWVESMAANATGFFAFIRVLADTMAERGGGSVVNIASMQGLVGMNPALYEGTTLSAPPDYFFHKAGMINLTRYLASHYGSRGVRVNCVSPGGIFNPGRPQAAEFLERYGRMTMLGRMAHAHEITGAVVFLLSDASSYVTGSNIVVDGGYAAK